LREDLVPEVARVEDVRRETSDVRTLRLCLEDPAAKEAFDFAPGQFCLISSLGAGEAAFAISSPPMWQDFFEITVRDVGKVTSAIHDLEIGDRVGVRGPYGNRFPYEDNFGRPIVIVGGGIGLAPLRPLIIQTIAERDRFGGLYIIYGARSVGDLVYRQELEDWDRREDLKVVTAVDPGGDDGSWQGEVGLVPEILERVAPPSDGALFTCGPPVMVKFVLASARRMGFNPADIVTTLEMRMTCGVGTCGRCNIGSRYVCRDGPVFTLKDLEDLPDEF
jgi:NAD(P)H-flavin reductase